MNPTEQRLRTTVFVLSIMFVVMTIIALVSVRSRWASEEFSKRAIYNRIQQALNHANVADSLLEVATKAQKELDIQQAISLKLSLQIDSINAQHHGFIGYLSGASTTELHHIADSILAGYNVNRARYLVLLRARSPGDVGQPVSGASGIGAP